MNWIEIAALIAVGVVLIAVDFYLPGFVLASIGAVLMLVAAGVCFKQYGLYAGAALLVTEIIIGVGAAYISIHYFPKTSTGQKMILAMTHADARSQAPRGNELIGREGVARTVLRPSGVAVVDGRRLDVVAESGMIERGSPIKVVAVQDNQIVVRKL